MEKNKKINSLTSTLILTTITLITWVFFSIYRAFVKPLPIVVPPEILEPIDPRLDSNILNTLQQRFDIDENQVPEITPLPTENPKSTPTSTPTPTANITPTPSINASGANSTPTPTAASQ